MPGFASGILGEVARFSGVGMLATATHYVTALALSRGLGLDPAWAALLGVNASAFVSYFGHGRFTFRRKLDHGSMLPRFIISTLAAYAISYFGVRALVFMTGLPDFVVYAVTIVGIVAFNYVLFRFWVFH